MKIQKKDGTLEDYNRQKIIVACSKAAKRAMVDLTDDDYESICNYVETIITNRNEELINIYEIHNIVEAALMDLFPKVAESYMQYRNYKKDFIHMMDNVYAKSQTIRYIGDRSNANTDSALVATKRSLIFNELNAELYKKFFLTTEEKQAIKDGYIYIHDISARLDTFNCFSRETKFITSQGVKSFYDFKDGDIVYVPTHTGEWKKATVKSYGKQKLNKIIFKRGSRGEKTVYATANHRWLLKNKSITTDLKEKDCLINTPILSTFEWDKLSNKEKKYWVYGFCMADGSTHQNSKNSWYSTIRLCKDKNKYVDYFLDAGFTVTSPPCYKGDQNVYIPHFKKSEFSLSGMTINEIKVFVNGYLCADGCKNSGTSPNSPWRGVQVTGENNNFIYDALNIAGYYVTNITDKTNEVTNYGKRKKDTKYYGFYSNQGYKNWVVQKIIPTNREEIVWCLEVQDNHSFILENGIVTGNCCLMDVGAIMQGGFEMGNIWYEEPNSIDTAFDVMGDIISATAAQQYGKNDPTAVVKPCEPLLRVWLFNC